METILTVLANSWSTITGGGVFGALGAGISKWMQGKELAKQREHELKLRELETDAERWKVMQEQRATEFSADAAARTAAMNWNPSVKGASQWVIDARSMHRPVLTYVLVVVATALVLWTDSYELIEYGVRSAVFLASAAVGFWFAERGLALPGQKH